MFIFVILNVLFSVYWFKGKFRKKTRIKGKYHISKFCVKNFNNYWNNRDYDFFSSSSTLTHEQRLWESKCWESEVSSSLQWGRWWCYALSLQHWWWRWGFLYRHCCQRLCPSLQCEPEQRYEIKHMTTREHYDRSVTTLWKWIFMPIPGR